MTAKEKKEFDDLKQRVSELEKRPPIVFQPYPVPAPYPVYPSYPWWQTPLRSPWITWTCNTGIGNSSDVAMFPNQVIS